MYAPRTQLNAYKQQGILTANPVELIVMLYDGCIKQLKIAALAIEEANYDRANTSIQKAEEIVVELVNSLDLQYPIANDLMDLYEFMLKEMIEINLEKETYRDRIDGLVEILTELRQTWNEIAKEGRGVVALVEE